MSWLSKIFTKKVYEDVQLQGKFKDAVETSPLVIRHASTATADTEEVLEDSLNKLTKKNQKRMIEHNDTYNNRWHSKNRTHQAILSYIHSYKYDIDGIYTMTKPEFNKLMKPYRRIKKYIFVVPEDKLNDVPRGTSLQKSTNL